MQASKATVDEVLEAIADCILQCVLFSTEADETGAKLKSLNTDALLHAMKFLADLATKKAAMWGELDKKMEQEMLSSTRELQQCVIAINRDIQTIADNPISKDAKKSLLLAAKSLMQRTVFLLQTADLYDIRQIIRLARESKDWNDKLVDCRNVVDIPEVVRE